MKKIILLALAALMMVGCEHKTNAEIEETKPEVYDIYFDVGLFSPLIKRWKIDKSALTREETIKYITPWLVDVANNKIYVAVEYVDKDAKDE